MEQDRISYITLALAKAYTDESVEGAGAIKGKNCEIQSIEPITGGNRVTFAWYNGSDVLVTDTLDVMDGEDGEKGDKGDKGDKGNTGATGNGISTIEKTSTVGNVDTYTITMTNGDTATFTVTNGGVNVVANPDGTASESLTKITIGDTIYAVSGGSGGASSYTELDDKPTVNNVTFVGDMTGANLGLVDAVNGKGLSTNDYTDADKTIVDGVTTALAGKVDTTSVGANSGVASLDANGKVPSAQLPSYVDDVLEYASTSAFPATGETGKIYVALDTNKTYRWGGSEYVEISESLALGETSSTAYAGNKGKANADAITAIKDGVSIDSFGDVETALSTKYDTSDTAETDLADGDYVPFYDTSATGKRKTLWSNIKAKLKTYFDTLYCAIGLVPSGATTSNKLATASDVASRVDWSSYAKTGVHNVAVIPASVVTKSENNVTFTVTRDSAGAVTEIDVDTGGSAASANTFFSINDMPLSAGDYILSQGFVTDASNNRLQILKSDSSWLAGVTEGNSEVSFSCATGKYILQIRIASGQTLSHLKVYPMIRLASDKNTSFATAVMTNRELTDAVATIPTVSVSHTGTASSTGVRKEVISVNSVDYDIDGSAYMEQSVTLSTSATTTVTFTNAIIADGKMFTLATSLWNLVPDDIVTTAGVCTITLPKWSSAETIGVRLYVR